MAGDMVGIVIAQFIVVVWKSVAMLNNSWPCVKKSRGYVVVDIGVEKLKFEENDKIIEGEYFKLFKERFCVVVISFVQQ